MITERAARTGIVSISNDPAKEEIIYSGTYRYGEDSGNRVSCGEGSG